jgi:circadian clock protein KaiC
MALGRCGDKGLLHFQAASSNYVRLEMHLVKMHKVIRDMDPSIVVVDPVSGLLHSGTPSETRTSLRRLSHRLMPDQIRHARAGITRDGQATKMSSPVLHAD